MDFFFLPILLFAVATALAYIGGALVYAAIVVSGQAAHKLAFRYEFKNFKLHLTKGLYSKYFKRVFIQPPPDFLNKL